MENKMPAMEILLDKMRRLLNSISTTNGRANSIDLDLMKDYTKQLYELLLEHETGKDISITIEENIEKPADFSMPKVVKSDIKPPVKTLAGNDEVEKLVMKHVHEKTVTGSNEEPKTKKPLVMHEDDEEDEEMSAMSNKIAKDKKTLADKLKTAGSVDLLSAIDLNDKSFFIRELFRGDHHAFSTAIKHMNALPDMSAVHTYIANECMTKYAWKATDESYIRFCEVLKEKFRV